MRKRPGPITIAIIMLVFSIAFSEDISQKAFPNKLIFSETPEMGRKWRGGIRMTDIIVWDMYFNFSDWFRLDILSSGFSDIGDDTIRITDKFSSITFQSRPFINMDIYNNPYKVAGGIKLYSDTTLLEFGPDTITYWDMGQKSLPLFITQSYQLGKKNFFNLYSSISFSGKSNRTYYVIPGYRFRISENWNFGLEYFMTNTFELPLRTFQIFLDPDGLPFLNLSRDMYSFMAWGIQYNRKHFHFSLNFFNHISFQPAVIPLIGIGWNF